MASRVKAIVMFSLGFPIITSVVFGQTDNQASRVFSAEASGVPTLKRREPLANSSSSPSPGLPSSPNEKVSNDQGTGCLKVRFEGLFTFKTAEVLRFFREQGIELSKNQMPETEVLARVVISTKEFLKRHGYMNPQVSAYRDQKPQTINVLVYEGPRSSVSGIRFEGNRIFASQELTARMQEYLVRLQPLDKGYDAEVLDYATRRLTDFMRSRGYLQATLRDPRLEVTESGLLIVIPIDEGPLFRLGDLTIEGAESFSEDQLRAILPLQRGDIAAGEFIAKWLFEDMRKIYGDMGFIQFTAEPEPIFKTLSDRKDEGVVDFRVYIEEGKRLKIRSIRFQGSDLITEALDKALLIHTGDFFSQKLLNESIKKLNEMSIFNQIDSDRDVDFKSDDESEILDIIITLSDIGSSNRVSKTNLPGTQPLR